MLLWKSSEEISSTWWELKTDEQIRRSRLELYHVIYLNVFLSLAWSYLPFVSFISQQEIPPVSQEILQ